MSSAAGVIIGCDRGNGGFVSHESGINGAPDGWAALRGVWIDAGNSPLGSGPFGADSAPGSRFVQIHNDAGETLTSLERMAVVPGELVTVDFDWKSDGSGRDRALDVELWDAENNRVHSRLGRLETAGGPEAFSRVTFSTTMEEAAGALSLRFVMPGSGGGQARDAHIDRVHLAGGTRVEPPPPQPVDFAYSHALLPGDSDERIIEKAAKTLPRPKQVAWQRLEETYFIHFGPNTFRGVEWGDGLESPSLFNPTALDVRQWTREIRAAGGRMLMLVVKHHEGFCLWPTRYTRHNVAASPWRDGAGDLVREVAEACAADGLKLGIYLSPADLYQIESRPVDHAAGAGLYGNGSVVRASRIPTDPASFGSDPSVVRTDLPPGAPVFEYEVDDYNRYFLNQLYELLTGYGPVHEVWFDGAHPKQTDPPQQYNRRAWYELIETLQPEAVIAIKGPDVRWVGNERGISRETEWSPLPIPRAPEDYDGGDMGAQDLGSRVRLTRGSHLTWYPAEADVPILHGWFWAERNAVRPVSELIDIYYRSVGRNSNLLLNLSPDRRGLIPENQLAPLRAMSQVIRQTFASDLAGGSTAAASTAHPAHPPGNAIDGNLDTWWEPEAGAAEPAIALTLPGEVEFDVVSLQEAIASRGQRVEAFAVDARSAGGGWREVARSTTIGHKRLLRLAEPQRASQLRVRFLESRLEPSLANLTLHRQAERVAEPAVVRSADGRVTITAAPGETIRFTLDGTNPDATSARYTGPLDMAGGGELRAAAFRENGSHSLPATRVFGILPDGWSARASAEAAAHPARNALDGDAATFWLADSATDGTPPHLVIDLAAALRIGGLVYGPRDNGTGSATDCTVEAFRIEVRRDDGDWQLVAEDTFGNIRNNPVEQTIRFPKVHTARELRFTAIRTLGGGPAASAATLTLLAPPPGEP